MFKNGGLVYGSFKISVFGVSIVYHLKINSMKKQKCFEYFSKMKLSFLFCSSFFLTTIVNGQKPTALTAIDINTNAFTVKWNAVSNATNYKLDVATDASFSNLIIGYKRLNVTDTFSSVIGLAKNTTYYIRVKSEVNGRISSNSNTVNATTLSDYTPGITVIVHGFQATGGYLSPTEDFVKMAIGIANRGGGALIYKNDPNTGQLETVSGSYTTNINKEVILVYDWGDLSNNYQTNSSWEIGNGYLESASDNLFATILELSKVLGISKNDLMAKPKHFIGHSRGCILLLQTLHRFAQYFPTVKFDQFTMLDPHPAAKFGDLPNEINIGLERLPCIYGAGKGCTLATVSYIGGCTSAYNISIKMPTNVSRGESYFRQDGQYEGIGNYFAFDGVPLLTSNKYNRQLNDNNLSLGSPILGGTHSAVHYWYRGTINLTENVATSTTSPYVSEYQNTINWYLPSMSSPFASNHFMLTETRETTGFFHSRIGGGSLVTEIPNGQKESLPFMNDVLKRRNKELNTAMTGIGLETVYGGYFANKNDAGWNKNGANSTAIFSTTAPKATLKIEYINFILEHFDSLEHSQMYFPPQYSHLNFIVSKILNPTSVNGNINFYNSTNVLIATHQIQFNNTASSQNIVIAIPPSLIGEVGKFSINGYTFDVSNVRLITQVEANNILTGLIAYYPFNGNANDESGNGNNGTVTNATLTTDRFGNANKAYYFDGNSKIIATDNLLPMGNKSRTITMWVNSSVLQASIHNGSPGYLFEYGVEGVTNNYFNIALWSNVLRVTDWSSPPDIDFAYNHPINQWFQIAVTLGNTNKVNIFINGILAYTSTVETWSTTSSGFLAIGKFLQNAKLDDIRVYNRTLTSAEISALYKNEAPQTNLATGLIAYYPFNGNGNDSSGNANHATPLNGVAFATDRKGKANSAIQLDGIDDYLTSPASASLNSISFANDFTFSAWVKTTGEFFVFSRTNGTDLHYRMYGHLNGIVAQCDNKTAELGISIQSNVWTLVTCTKRGSIVRFFKNGTLVGVANISPYSDPINDILALEIGRDNHGFTKYMNGQLDEIRIYNRGLTATEVRQLYKSDTSTTNPSITKPSTSNETSSMQSLNLSADNSVEETIPASLEINIYPNPTGNLFNIQVKTPKQEGITIRVLDVTGRTAYTTKSMPNQNIRFGEQLIPGTYLVEARQGNEVKTMIAVKMR